MRAPGQTTLSSLRARLGERPASLCEDAMKNRAAVALVLRERAGDLDLLFIRRAENGDDHWSGHIAFPGGRVDPGDAGPRAAAEREAREEVGLVLSTRERLGRLDDLMGQTQSIVVSAFVYGLQGDSPLLPNHEVAEAFWMPLAELLDPTRFQTRTFHYLDQDLELPALDVTGDSDPVLWGLSYRFLELLMSHVGRPIPSMPWRPDL